MLAPATGRSSEGETSVKADEGPLDRASIAAPARAAIAPPDNVRETMIYSLFILLCVLTQRTLGQGPEAERGMVAPPPGCAVGAGASSRFGGKPKARRNLTRESIVPGSRNGRKSPTTR
jgi:hypothetical protein